MGYDLTSKNDYFRLNWDSYHYLMELAFNNGWNPKGTVMSEMMAEYLTEHRLPPRFSTTFCFAVLNTPSVTYDKCHHSDHKLTEEEKLVMAKDPEEFFDLSDNLSCELERPIKLVKIKEEPPTLYLTETREEVKAEWDGNYFGNSFQIIEADDCLGIAKALRKASMKGVKDLHYAIEFFQSGPVQIG